MITMYHRTKHFQAYVFRLHDVNDNETYRIIVIDNDFFVDYFDDEIDTYTNYGKF